MFNAIVAGKTRRVAGVVLRGAAGTIAGAAAGAALTPVVVAPFLLGGFSISAAGPVAGKFPPRAGMIQQRPTVRSY